MDKEIGRIFRQILKDIKVELGDEFDRNFERQAFFSEAWQRRRSRGGRTGRATLIDTGSLRKSITSRSDATSITFYTTVPYAAIHNDGGEITVTERMKRYFRYRFYQAQGGFQRSGREARRPLTDGGFYAWTDKMTLTDEAEMWRYMALMKVGSTIKIPRRRFLGASPEVESAVREIIEENLTEYLGDELATKFQKDIDKQR